MIKLVVFDWNGTLIADTVACMAADNHVLQTFGGKKINLKTYRDTIIIPAINFYVQHGCDRKKLESNFKKLGEVLHKYYEPRVAKVRTRRNAKKLLRWLLKNNIQSVVLSNHTVTGIMFQLKRLGLESFISDILANTKLDSSMRKRHKDERLTDYLHKTNIKPHEVIIIGDSPEETEIGKKNHLHTVSITHGYYATHRLKKAQPDYLINNLDELITIIKTI